MRYVTLSSMASLTVPYFSTLSDKRYDIRKKVSDHKTRVLILFTTFLSFLILRRIERSVM